MRPTRAAFIISATLLLVAFGILGGQRPPSRISARAAGGSLYLLQLDAAAFPDPARSDGYESEGESYPLAGHYDDSSVAVFIPSGLAPSGAVDLVFFFHGWYSSIAEEIRDFDLLRQFTASGRRAILVLPETARDAPDSYGGKLERPGDFDRMLAELLGTLHAEGITPWLTLGAITLAGHSGAYHVIARIIDGNWATRNLREVCLFDALYDNLASYTAWIATGRGLFVSISAEGGDPADNADEIIARLRGEGIAVATGWDDPKLDPSLLGHRVVFLTSPLAHENLVYENDEFRRVLAAGGSAR